jgi:hypothetical protein
MNRTRCGWEVGAIALAGVLGLSSRAGGQISEAAGVRAAVPFELGRFDLNVGGSLHRVGLPVGPRTPYTLESKLRLPLTSSGFSLGAGVEDVAADSLPARPFVSYEAWRSFRLVLVSIGLSAHVASSPLWLTRPSRTDTIGGVLDTIPSSRLKFWPDAEGRIAWRFSELTMEAVFGARGRVESYVPSVWGRLGASYPLSSRFALVAAAGSEPTRPSLGLPASNFVSLALRVRPWRSPSGIDSTQPTAFTVERTNDREYRILYAVANATTVELSGDFNGWRPMKLVSSRAGIWETTMQLTPGTYHVNLRVDGGRWLPPPGLPQADDDFNGAVGVLVVR